VNVLKDLRRRFNVDSDRVFLLGAGEGGAMALDVGLSHPDLFAGVVPMSATPNLFSLRYASVEVGNGQNLPFYVVHGTMAGEQLVKNVGLLFNAWIPQGYPSLHVEYNQRGLEWFAYETLTIFDWMNRKKRVSGYPNLGRHHFMTMRETDNSFYWLTAEAIRPGNVNDARNWRPSVTGARLHGRIVEGNQVVVDTRGILRGTVWLARDAVDFSKPVVIKVNGSASQPRTIKPNLATLLEDLYQRGDRQHLFLAKESFELK
jgi:pimeloyl-ACP methyl ester carboxylesterase